MSQDLFKVSSLGGMNLILLRPDDAWTGDHLVRLSDRRADHIRSVLRANVGDVLRVGVLGADQGLAQVQAIDASGVLLSVQLSDPPPPRHRFDVVLALPRPKMLRRILRTVAEFGVGHLHLINSARVDKSYWQSPLLAHHKLQEALWSGMERSRDTVRPEIHCYQRFRPFVEDQLPLLFADRPCWIADHGAPLGLAQTPPGPAVVMIGPEGGFVPFEIELACSVGAQRVHLGERILSVDTAVPSALAQGLMVASATSSSA